MATREITTRLLSKNQEPIAIGLVASVTPPGGDTAPTIGPKNQP